MWVVCKMRERREKREKMIGVFLEKKGERRVFFLDFGLGEE